MRMGKGKGDKVQSALPFNQITLFRKIEENYGGVDINSTDEDAA